MKKHLLSVIILPFLFLRAAAAAQAGGQKRDPLAGSGPFADPVFQDFLETSDDGYLNAKNTMLVRTDFGDMRDSVASPRSSLRDARPSAALSAAPAPKAAPRYPAGHYKVTFAGEAGPLGSYVMPVGSAPSVYPREYALLGVSVAGGAYDALLPALERAGLRFAGEKDTYSSGRKRTVVLGWAPYSAIPAVSRVRGVSGVAVENSRSGMQLRARVRFTLKVPFQNGPDTFVPGFLKGLSKSSGFVAESWTRLPVDGGDSRFSVFDVTGTMPVNMLSGLSASPFVASVELKDSSL